MGRSRFELGKDLALGLNIGNLAQDAPLLDGRNRLDAIELFSNELVDDEYRENLAALAAVSDANTRFYSEHEILNPTPMSSAPISIVAISLRHKKAK